MKGIVKVLGQDKQLHFFSDAQLNQIQNWAIEKGFEIEVEIEDTAGKGVHGNKPFARNEQRMVAAGAQQEKEEFSRHICPGCGREYEDYCEHCDG